MSELDPRKQSILQALVLEYVDAAEPVGSELLVHKYHLGVKSATVRNELAEMSELGYLEQPHTSAGRIPSDRGYRYYVDRLLLERDVDPQVKQRVRTVTQEGDALQALLTDTARVLSRFSQLLTVAATTQNAGITVRSALVSALGPTQALFVLVLSNGHVVNRVIEVPAGLTLQDIGAANEALAKGLPGLNLGNLSRAKAPGAPGNGPLDRLQSTVWTCLRSMARELTRGRLVVEGEEYIFAKPEFQRDVSAISELFENLLGGSGIFEALAPSGESGAQVVTIGKENRNSHLHAFSMVRKSFFVGDTEAGVIALIGPTRMQYDRSIPLVNYTANALSQSLTRFFG
jgi:heat-inducible transcriptional repressor